MKLRNLRWGYDGGGIACGPVDGSSVVEVCVTDNNRCNHWVVVSRMCDAEKVLVSPMPLFDILIQFNHYDVDFDHEFDKCLAVATEEYDYEIYEPDENMEKSEFAKVIRFARNAMVEYYGNDDEDTDAETAREYFEQYRDAVIEEIDVPEVEYDDDFFDDEEDFWDEEEDDEDDDEEDDDGDDDDEDDDENDDEEDDEDDDEEEDEDDDEEEDDDDDGDED